MRISITYPRRSLPFSDKPTHDVMLHPPPFLPSLIFKGRLASVVLVLANLKNFCAHKL